MLEVGHATIMPRARPQVFAARDGLGCRPSQAREVGVGGR